MRRFFIPLNVNGLRQIGNYALTLLPRCAKWGAFLSKIMKFTDNQKATAKAFRKAAKGRATVTVDRLSCGSVLIRASMWDRKPVSIETAKQFHPSAIRWHFINELGAVIT